MLLCCVAGQVGGPEGKVGGRRLTGTAEVAGAVEADVLDTEQVLAVLDAAGDLDGQLGFAWGRGMLVIS